VSRELWVAEFPPFEQTVEWFQTADCLCPGPAKNRTNDNDYFGHGRGQWKVAPIGRRSGRQACLCRLRLP